MPQNDETTNDATPQEPAAKAIVEAPTTALESPTVLPVIIGMPTPEDSLEERGTQKRDEYNRVLSIEVDLIAIAKAAFCQKIASMSWVLLGPETPVRKWQEFLNLIGEKCSWTASISQAAAWFGISPKGVYIQIERLVPSWAVEMRTLADGTQDKQFTKRGIEAIENGEDKDWEIVDLHVLDSRYCSPTGDPAKPLTYTPATGGDPITLRRHDFLHIIDTPEANALKPGLGFCSVDRCIEVGRRRKAVARYYRECFEDKPSPGILILNGVQAVDWEAMEQQNLAEMKGKGIQTYHGMYIMYNNNVQTASSYEMINFRIVPEGYDQKQDYQECKEVIAAAWGLDVLEFGAMPGQALGSAEQATVMHKKSKGRTLALFAEGLERELRNWVLPPNVEFRLVAQDVEEEREKNEALGVAIENVVKMWTPDQFGERLLTRDEARQLLADGGAIPKEYIEVDTTDYERVEETEAKAGLYAGEPIVKMWDDGRVRILREGRRVPFPWAKAASFTDEQWEMRTKAMPYLLTGKAQLEGRSRPRNVRATIAYENDLTNIYTEWAEEAAAELESVDPEEREQRLDALLALLALRLKAAVGTGLNTALEIGSEGTIPDLDALATLEATIESDQNFVDTTLIPDVKARLLKEAQMVPGFLWTAAQIAPAFAAMAYRLHLYGGNFWATLALGVGLLVKARGDKPVRRFLDPAAKHCDTCPPKAAEYANWDTMVAECGGLPGDGSDDCDGGCRCGVEEEQQPGVWVEVL